jgi:hypothetical protein
MSDPIPGTVHIDHCDEVLVHMAAGTHSWCQLVTFFIRTASADDSQVISAMIRHRRYRDHCAGPFGEQDYHELHGPYRIETITVSAFQRCSIADAVEILYAWPGYELTPHYAHTWQQSQEIIGVWVTPVLLSATTI